jgi:hypothetical protein
VQEGDQGRHAWAKRTRPHRLRQCGAHLLLTVRTTHGAQAILCDVRLDGRHFGNLVPLRGGDIGQVSG